MKFSFRSAANIAIVLACVVLIATSAMPDQVAVHFPQGSTNGLLLVRSVNGKAIGNGDLTETVHGDRVTCKFSLHFDDGSQYEETTEFSEKGKFRVLTYHMTQKGPSFRQAIEMTMNAETGDVSVQTTDDNGKQNSWSRQMKIPADVANGIVPFLASNLTPSDPKASVTMVAATPKPRLVQLTIAPEGTESFPLDGTKIEATRYAVKVDLGGLIGPVAKVTGRQPPDTILWVLRSKVPTFLMAQETFVGGPVCRIQLASPSMPAAGPSDARPGH